MNVSCFFYSWKMADWPTSFGCSAPVLFLCNFGAIGGRDEVFLPHIFRHQLLLFFWFYIKGDFMFSSLNSLSLSRIWLEQIDLGQLVISQWVSICNLVRSGKAGASDLRSFSLCSQPGFIWACKSQECFFTLAVTVETAYKGMGDMGGNYATASRCCIFLFFCNLNCFFNREEWFPGGFICIFYKTFIFQSTQRKPDWSIQRSEFQ